MVVVVFMSVIVWAAVEGMMRRVPAGRSTNDL